MRFLLLLVFFTVLSIADDAGNDDMFAVEYLPPGSLATASDNIDTPASNWVVMTAANGTKYDCNVAVSTPIPELDRAGARAKLIGSKVPAGTRDRIHKMLDGTCTMVGKGWWVYEVCWGKHIRQYHQGADQNIETEYVLGYGPEKKIRKGATTELFYGESPVHGIYVSAGYFNGTDCDLTGKPRETELRLACLEDDGGSAPMALVDVTESSTCAYAVLVKSLKVCEIAELRKELRETRKVKCYQRSAYLTVA
jgi:protein OS-9